MFILTPTENFKATVKTQVATQSGAWREESFVGIFKRTGEELREELIALTNKELLQRVLVDWEMKDEKGDIVPFSDENFAAFCRLIGPMRDAALTYWNHNAGAKVKN